VELPRPVIALALGSGGARGFAHVGVIKALEDAGIRPDIIVGASSGAVVGALYAAGHDAAGLEALAARLESDDLIDVSVLDGFKVRGERLEQFVSESLAYRPIEALPRPFAVIATDAQTGAATVFNRGNPGKAVRASSSVPRLFLPTTINGRQYIDGGIISPVPVKLARAMGADIVIAVDISRVGMSPELPRTERPAGASDGSWSRTARRALLAEELAHASVVIRPVLARGGLLDFDQKQAALSSGERAARDALPQLAQMLRDAALAKAQVYSR
jgi:NTE family protein